jgi:hypothetical protein
LAGQADNVSSFEKESMEEQPSPPVEEETPADAALEVGDRLFNRFRPFVYGLTAIFAVLFVIFPAHGALFLTAAWTTLFLGICLLQVWALLFDAGSRLLILAICALHALVMFLVQPYLHSGRYILPVLGAAVEFALTIVLSTWLAMRFNRWKSSSRETPVT